MRETLSCALDVDKTLVTFNASFVSIPSFGVMCDGWLMCWCRALALEMHSGIENLTAVVESIKDGK